MNEDKLKFFKQCWDEVYKTVESNKLTNNKNLKENNKMFTINVVGDPRLTPFVNIQKAQNQIEYPEPVQIYYNEEKEITTVLWNDGTKTMVKLSSGERYAPDGALGYALLKKVYGTRSNYMKFVDKTKIMRNNKKLKLEDSSFIGSVEED